MTEYRLIGTGTTNGQGIATLNKKPDGTTITGYTGTGAGKLNLIASTHPDPTDPDALTSSIILYDCLKYDSGKDPGYTDSIWYSTSNLTRGADYTTIAADGSTLTAWVAINQLDDFRIEIDINVQANNSSSLVSIRTGTGVVRAEVRKDTFNTLLSNNNWYHINFTVRNNTCTVTCDEVEGSVVSDVSNTARFYIRAGSAQGVNETLRFRDLRIYQI